MPSSAHNTKTKTHTVTDAEILKHTHHHTLSYTNTVTRMCMCTHTYRHKCCCKGSLFALFLVSLNCQLQLLNMKLIICLFCGEADTIAETWIYCKVKNIFYNTKTWLPESICRIWNTCSFSNQYYSYNNMFLFIYSKADYIFTLNLSKLPILIQDVGNIVLFYPWKLLIAYMYIFQWILHWIWCFYCRFNMKQKQFVIYKCGHIVEVTSHISTVLHLFPTICLIHLQWSWLVKCYNNLWQGWQKLLQ